jgi:hypothetical protein
MHGSAALPCTAAGTPLHTRPPAHLQHLLLGDAAGLQASRLRLRCRHLLGHGQHLLLLEGCLLQCLRLRLRGSSCRVLGTLLLAALLPRASPGVPRRHVLLLP